MSINRDMSKHTLIKKVESARSPSGAVLYDEVRDDNFLCAVYKKNDSRVYGSVVYDEATHTALTFRKDVAIGNNINDSNVSYQIISCNTEGRLTNLLLKEVAKIGG